MTFAQRPLPSIQQHDVDTGRVAIATATTTTLDIVEAPRFAAGLSNVGIVLGELLIEELVEEEQLADAAATYPAAVAQRTGWIIEYTAREVGAAIALDALAETVTKCDYTVLDPRSAAQGRRDPRGGLVINADMEHDL